MPAFAERLADVLDRAMEGRLLRPELPASYPPMAPEACRASLLGCFPLFMDWGEQRRIAVRVRNRSEREWPPHRISQLILGSRWLNVAHSQVGSRSPRFTVISFRGARFFRYVFPLDLRLGGCLRGSFTSVCVSCDRSWTV